MSQETNKKTDRTVIPLAEDHKWHESPTSKLEVDSVVTRSPPSPDDFVKLGDLAPHFAPFKATEASLAQLGFQPLKGLVNAKLYDKRDIGAMLLKSAERFLENRKKLNS